MREREGAGVMVLRLTRVLMAAGLSTSVSDGPLYHRDKLLLCKSNNLSGHSSPVRGA